MLFAAVADGDVEVAVGAEAERAALVVPGGVGDPKQFLLAGRVCLVRVGLGDAKARKDRGERHFLGRILHEELAVLPVARVKRHPQKTLLVLLVEEVHLLREIEKHLRFGRVGLEHVHDTLLLGHEDPVGSITGMGEQNGAEWIYHAVLVGLPAGPFQRWKCDHRFHVQRRLVHGDFGAPAGTIPREAEHQGTCGDAVHGYILKREGEKVSDSRGLRKRRPSSGLAESSTPPAQ